MSTDLTVPDQLLDPRTGELYPATPERAAEFLQAARELKARMDGLIDDATDVLVEEAYRQGKKTLQIGGGKVVLYGGPKGELVWDHELLEQLREVGLPEERWDDLVTVEVTYKVDARVAKQLEAANEVYADVIDRARSYAETKWRAYIK